MCCDKQNNVPIELEHQYDECVLCGRLTSEKKETPIEMRSDYLIGAGQLCRDCYRELKPEFEAEYQKLWKSVHGKKPST